MTKFLITAAILAAITTGASAADLKAETGQTINLGSVSGAAYYTVEENGLRLVATVADGETGAPIRFVSTLEDGQALTIAVPAAEGKNPEELTFRRDGDRLTVDNGDDLRAALTD